MPIRTLKQLIASAGTNISDADMARIVATGPVTKNHRELLVRLAEDIHWGRKTTSLASARALLAVGI
jgi:hypothetical protein